MLKMILKSILLLFSLFLLNNQSSAINVNGYIITENSDTVFGTIQLQKFDQVTGNLVINGFDREILHKKLSFKSVKDKKYKTYLPETISGFGFNYEKERYVFQSFTLERKSLVKRERFQSRFLCLVYRGSLSLFKDIKSYNFDPSNITRNYNSYTYSEFFLYQPSVGLIKVEITDKISSIKDLLRQFNCNELFVQKLKENIRISNILDVLKTYDQWLSNQHSGMII